MQTDGTLQLDQHRKETNTGIAFASQCNHSAYQHLCLLLRYHFALSYIRLSCLELINLFDAYLQCHASPYLYAHYGEHFLPQHAMEVP